MPPLKLTFACGLYDRMLALYTKDVRPDGVELDFHVHDDPRQTFDRMARDQPYDVAEMSSSEFIQRKSAGGAACPFVALPVFASRVFRHSFIWGNRKLIRTPKDLEGKRVGVPLYTMTAAIWQRGHLMHEYGVDLSTVRWVQGAINARTSHGTPTVLPLLKPVAIEQAQGQSLSELLDAGEIAAMLGTNPPDCFGKNPDIVRLFPNFREVERDYYTRTRIFPIMHLVVIKQEVHEKHPAVAASLYRAFCAAKDMALEKMRFTGTLRYMLPFLPDDLDEIDRVFGGDPWPYGVEPNRPTLEALVQYLAEQNVIAKPPPIESLFLPV